MNNPKVISFFKWTKKLMKYIHTHLSNNQMYSGKSNHILEQILVIPKLGSPGHPMYIDWKCDLKKVQ